jgi:hypothetical protein
MKLRYIVPALAAAALVPSLAFGSAGTSSSSVEVIGVAAGIKFVDADGNGKPSVGDYEIGKTKLVDPSSGRTVGSSAVNCAVLNGAGTQYLCSGYNHLAGGEIMVSGYFSVLSKTYRLAIVGGTGQYAGIRGWESGTWLNAKLTKVRITDTFNY